MNQSGLANLDLPILDKSVNGRAFWTFAFFMAFPNLVIGINVSLLFFVFVFLTALRNGETIVSFKFLTFVFLLFGLGAFLSYTYSDDTQNSLAVLPNYLYWMVILVFIYSKKGKIDFQKPFEMIFYGLMLSVLYFFIIQFFLSSLPIFRILSPNNFSFLLIIFTPIALLYVRNRWGTKFLILAGILFSLSGFLSGSRAGSLIVFFEFLAVSLLQNISLRAIFIYLVIGLIGFQSIQSEFVQSFVRYLNPRVYELVYDTESVVATDRSILVRMAMIEKGLSLFEENPWTGVGLNNFGASYGFIAGDFQGSEYVIKKQGLNEISSHNSYIHILAEGGLLLFVPFLLILSLLLLRLLLNFNQLPDEGKVLFFSCLCIMIHFFVITSVVNVYPWFIFGLGYSIALNR